MKKQTEKAQPTRKQRNIKEKSHLAADRLDDLLLKEGRGAAAKLAAELNVEPQAISNYRRGIADPTMDNLIKIAEHYHVSVDWLLGRLPKENRSDDELVRVAANYTGLSSDAVEKLHTWQQPNTQFEGRTKSWTKMLSNLIVSEGESQILHELWVYLRLHESRGRFALCDTKKFLNDPDPNHCRLGWYGDDEVFLQLGEAQLDLNYKRIESVQLDLLTDAIKEYRKSIWRNITEAAEAEE